MKKKSKEWINASINKRLNRQVPFIGQFIETKSKIMGSKQGYFVVATEDLLPGDIIEEVPVLGLHTTVQDLVEAGDNADPILIDYGVFNFSQKPEFEDEGNPVCIGLGNFNIYKKSDKANAIHNYDTNFNIVTIRATQEIKKGSEILLFRNTKNEDSKNAQPKKEKSMGCGCGKKKQQKKEQQKKEEPDNQPKVKSSTFKSMVDGKELKSIKVD